MGYGDIIDVNDMNMRERIVDLRSDTFTLPDDGMRRAIAEASVGDDCYGEDPSIKKLEAEMATLTGKEFALFTTSGTQGNLICAILHGQDLFSEIIMGSMAHAANLESCGASLFRGISIRHIPNQPDGTMNLEEIKANIVVKEDIHKCITKAVFLENTQMLTGGKVLPMSYVKEVRTICDKYGIALHCDAARIWNAVVALKLPLKEVLAPFDTASICMSKGLGAPVGSVIVGTKNFIQQAIHIRKALGGGMRQSGFLAAACLYALQYRFPRIIEDHEMMQKMSELLRQANIPHDVPESNILIIRPCKTAADSKKFVDECGRHGVLCFCNVAGPGTVRVIAHYGNTMDDITYASYVIKSVYLSLNMKK